MSDLNASTWDVFAVTITPAHVDGGQLTARLSTLDRCLVLWILAAMGLGLGLGRLVPQLGEAMGANQMAGVSVPIAVGLPIMMYPVLAKVRYSETGKVLGDKRLMATALVINWGLAPARCIAMVFSWNDLACGDREAAAVLVAINSVFQVFALGALGWFSRHCLPALLGLPTTSSEFSFWTITLSVLVFLGIPLVAGFLSRTLGERAKGWQWYEGTFLPKIGPWALHGLLFTIVLRFALQGDAIIAQPLSVVRIALPLLACFVVVFGASTAIGFLLRPGCARTTTLAFTAASNTFELAIAVCTATYGVTSGQAPAGVVGPVIGALVVALDGVALWSRKFFTSRPVEKVTA